MKISDISNINHCTVEPVAKGRMYRIIANDGWYIHLNTGKEDTANVYKTAVVLGINYPFDRVEIVDKNELPKNAEIY